SEHPLAHAIVQAAREQQLKLATAEDFDSASGVGVRGKVQGRQVALGNTVLMEQVGINWRPLEARANELREQGASVIYLGEQRGSAWNLVGILSISDPIKNTTPEALKAIRKAGIKVGMATGDGERTA